MTASKKRQLAPPASVVTWPVELMTELRAIGTIIMGLDLIEDYQAKITVLRAALLLSGLNVDVVKR